MFNMEETVLIYLQRNNQYLMLFRNKKSNDLNKGKYLGIGGHIENNESQESAAIREVKEETGLNLLSSIKRGIITFTNDDYSEIMHLFTSQDFNGELIECDEGTLEWVDIDKITYLPIWDGDKYFLELLKNDEQYFELELKYSNDKLIDAKRIK